MEMSFPADAPQSDACIGVTFLATDNINFFGQRPFMPTARPSFGGKPIKSSIKSSSVWKAMTNNLVKTGPTDVNSVRAVVKNGAIPVIVNGQTVKSVRAKIPGGDRQFGFLVGYLNPSAKLVSFIAHSYKVTGVE